MKLKTIVEKIIRHLRNLDNIPLFERSHILWWDRLPYERTPGQRHYLPYLQKIINDVIFIHNYDMGNVNVKYWMKGGL